MIKITGKVGKSIIYEKLCLYPGTVGFVLDVPGYYPGFGYVIQDPNPKDFENLIPEGLPEFTDEVILYSNYSKEKIAPYMEAISRLEMITSIKFIVMYKE